MIKIINSYFCYNRCLTIKKTDNRKSICYVLFAAKKSGIIHAESACAEL